MSQFATPSQLDTVARQAAEPKKPVYPFTAPCSGALMYLWKPFGNPGNMDVLVSVRADVVGPGLGITGGGFAETISFVADHAIGTVASMTVEAYRENQEEFDGEDCPKDEGEFHKIIPEDVFAEYAQPIDGYMILKKDRFGNAIHAPVYYAFPVLDDEAAALMALPPTKERAATKRMTLKWTKSYDGDRLLVTISLWDGDVQVDIDTAFFHAHEWRCAFVSLVELAVKNRLWNDRR